MYQYWWLFVAHRHHQFVSCPQFWFDRNFVVVWILTNDPYHRKSLLSFKMINKQTNIPFTCQSNDEIGKLSRKVVKKKKIDIILRFFCCWLVSLEKAFFSFLVLNNWFLFFHRKRSSSSSYNHYQIFFLKKKFWLHVFFHEKNPHNRLQNDLKHITEKQKFLGSHVIFFLSFFLSNELKITQKTAFWIHFFFETIIFFHYYQRN